MLEQPIVILLYAQNLLVQEPLKYEKKILTSLDLTHNFTYIFNNYNVMNMFTIINCIQKHFFKGKVQLTLIMLVKVHFIYEYANFF